MTLKEDYDALQRDYEHRLAPLNARALAIVEQRARRILRSHNSLVEFVMAMGTAFFVTAAGDTVRTHERAYMRPLHEFLEEWTDALGLLGQPMRFTADGDVRTDW